MTYIKREIVIRLIGGLGNQLFQLQYAYFLKKKFNCSISIDISFYKYSKKTHEQFWLQNIINEFRVNNLNTFELKVIRLYERILYKLKLNNLFIINYLFIFENNNFVFNTRKKLVADGFWQNKKYYDQEIIEKIRNKIINETCSHPATNSFLSFNRCLIHVRRGDYLTDKRFFRQTNLVINHHYYDAAISMIANKFKNIIFDIFSDDEEWAKNYFLSKGTNFNIIKTVNMSPIELLHNMQKYDKFILANSTLSWWAAVLAQNVNKTIIIPKKWGLKNNSDHLKLDSWIAI